MFAEARDLGAVHQVTLADGHDAWLIVRYDEAMAALSDLRLSKDMHAALSSGSEGPAPFPPSGWSGYVRVSRP